MFKKYLTFTLAALVLNLSLSASVFAETKEEKATTRTEKVKASIIRLGTGKDARVEVKLRDKAKVKGYVSEINDKSFIVVDEKTGVTTEILYSQTKQIKGNNLSTGVKILIGVAIVLAVLFIIGSTVSLDR